jgi:hypothetical protein
VRQASGSRWCDNFHGVKRASKWEDVPRRASMLLLCIVSQAVATPAGLALEWDAPGGCDRSAFVRKLPQVPAGTPIRVHITSNASGYGGTAQVGALSRQVNASACQEVVCRRSRLRRQCFWTSAKHLQRAAPLLAPFDAATCLLVSQFLMDRSVRVALFHDIAQRLRPGGILVSADLSAQVNPEAQRSLLDVWFRAMGKSGLPEDLERMRAAFARDVAVLPVLEVQQLIASVGFETPVPFLQAGLIHAWYSIRA